MRAQRFVLSPLCVSTIDDLAHVEAAERTRDYVFAPAENTWIEWRDGSVGAPGSARHGILLIGADQEKGRRSLVTGDGLYVFDAPFQPLDEKRIPMGVPILYDFAGDGSILKPQIKSAWRLLQRVAPRVSSTDFNAIGVWIIAALALINTPRISEIRDKDVRRVNKNRRDRPPLLEHKEVSIRVDAGLPGNGLLQNETGERALHHVRAFLRLKRGKVELVHPHWRGNPRFGVIRHRYAVLRSEDESGPWKGGPLPAPEIIHELKEGS